MQLETERLVLTPISPNDWSLFYEIHKDKDVMHYVTDDLSEQNIKTRFDARLKPWDPRCNEWLTLTIAIKDTGEKIGFTGFLAQWQPYQQAELGFLLSPKFQGKGYAKESTIALLDYIFIEQQYHKAVATVTEGNHPSANLLQNLGFRLEGTIRDNFKLNGQWFNDLKLGLLRTEYQTE